MLPLRAAPVLASMLYPTVPDPIPGAPEVIEIQLSPVVAVHEQVLMFVVTAIVPVPLPEPNDSLVGAIE